MSIKNIKAVPLAEIKCLNAGMVSLMEVDGTDLTPVQAARTSYRSFVDEHTDQENENLVDYLIRNHHDSPIEFPDVTFHMVLPIFVARQLIRNARVGVALNEESLRYISPRPDYYIPSPEECRKQSSSSKQGSSEELVDSPEDVVVAIQAIGDECHNTYSYLQATGLSNELCRVVLPLGQYTAWYWKTNLRSLFHLLKLRLDPHAQAQTRVYAQAMLDLVTPHFPNTVAAWENHVLNSVTFSQDEWKAIKDTTQTFNIDITYHILATAKSQGMRSTRLKELENKLSK